MAPYTEITDDTQDNTAAAATAAFPLLPVMTKSAQE